MEAGISRARPTCCCLQHNGFTSYCAPHVCMMQRRSSHVRYLFTHTGERQPQSLAKLSVTDIKKPFRHDLANGRQIRPHPLPSSPSFSSKTFAVDLQRKASVVMPRLQHGGLLVSYLHVACARFERVGQSCLARGRLFYAHQAYFNVLLQGMAKLAFLLRLGSGGPLSTPNLSCHRILFKGQRMGHVRMSP